MTRPLAIDLFCGLGGWTEGLLAEGYDVIGFDIEAHEYGEDRYPGKLVLQDVPTLHGSQFKDAALIVASPPCQEFSYMAMPWSRAKQIARALRGKGDFPEGYKGSRTLAELTALFDACFRLQREASEAAGHVIPLLVENVRGAEPWVGRARWSFGSYFLWGDVPALMPKTFRTGPGEAVKRSGRTMCFPAGSSNPDAVKGRTGKLHWQDDVADIGGPNHEAAGIKQGRVVVPRQQVGEPDAFQQVPSPQSRQRKDSQNPVRTLGMDSPNVQARGGYVMTNALEAYAAATARKNGSGITWYKDEIKAIERLTGVSYALIKGPSRQAAIVAARWMVIAVLRQRGWSLLKIGRELNRDHTTIMYALERMKQSAEARA